MNTPPRPAQEGPAWLYPPFRTAHQVRQEALLDQYWANHRREMEDRRAAREAQHNGLEARRNLIRLFAEEDDLDSESQD